MVMFHPHLIHHHLGDLQETFFQTNHRHSSNVGTNTTQTMSGDCLMGEFERVIEEKEKQKEEIVPNENIIFTMPKAPTILDDQDFNTRQEIKKTKRW